MRTTRAARPGSPRTSFARYSRGLLAAVTVAAFAGCSSTAPKPKIGFQPSTITLTATAGASAGGSIAVKNIGGGTLSGLAVAVGAYSNGASGWLTATLATANAPTSLILSADATDISAGSYSAVVNVSAAGASPPTATVTVHLTVSQ
jgi:hypothetical protein